MSGALLIAGTSSDAGKSIVTAGLCRALSRNGVSVAPFKAQNMALNSAVTPAGAEIGRAQAAQAQAAGVAAEVAMNPVLIKPSGERHSQLVVMGKPYADVDARGYQLLKPELRPLVLEAFESLRERFDVVVCEGAGSPAEINLRESDLANLGLAQDAGMPVLLVADIDRGGALAGLYGTLAILDGPDQDLIAGFILNKFRGEEGILAPGIERLRELTGRPTLGVLPWRNGLWLDAEDSLALDGPRDGTSAPRGADWIDIAVVRLRWISNFTDYDALASEPGVTVCFTRSPTDIRRADLVIVPGTKATVEDLGLLRERGLDRALHERAGSGAPVLGICGGYQLLGRRILDSVESGVGEVEGLGLLPVETEFEPSKRLAWSEGTLSALGGAPARGYEIRHGRVERKGGQPLLSLASGLDEGCLDGAVLGTSLHGLLEGDELRRSLLGWVARQRGLEWIAGTESFESLREARFDSLADLVSEHADLDAIQALIEGGVPKLPRVARGVEHELAAAQLGVAP